VVFATLKNPIRAAHLVFYKKNTLLSNVLHKKCQIISNYFEKVKGVFMNKKDYNKKALQDVYKNAHIALQSIKDVLPSVQNKELKNELKIEYDGYEEVINELKLLMSAKGVKQKDINVFKKMMMFLSIKMKLAFNNSKNQIADMMIKGSIMGINELTAMKNESSNLTEDVYNSVDKLLKLEEEYLERLKKFL
jgi:hypothetical protein